MLAVDHKVIGFLVPRDRRIVAVNANLDVADIPLGSLVLCGIGGLLLQLRVVFPASPAGAHRVIAGVVRLHPRPVLPCHIGLRRLHLHLGDALLNTLLPALLASAAGVIVAITNITDTTLADHFHSLVNMISPRLRLYWMGPADFNSS